MYDDRLVSVVDSIKHAEDKMVEAYWEGDIEKAEMYQLTLEYLRLLQAQGDLYIPNF